MNTQRSSVSAELFEQADSVKGGSLELDDDDLVTVELTVVPTETVEQTNSRIYNNTVGHYFVAEDSDAADVLDDLFASYATENSIISTFNRPRGSAYEVVVERREDDNRPEQFRNQKAWLTVDSDDDHFDDVESFLDAVDDSTF